MGKLKDAAERVGVDLACERTRPDEVEYLLELSRSDVPEERRVAVRDLCTCRVQSDNAAIWDRLMELAHDPDVGVRRDVLHSMTDSTPAGRVSTVLEVLESRRNDPDLRLRRRIRKTLAHYRRTGEITDGPG